ncbi:universal stress protein [Arthrobacter livingstonensis]|uniref:Universal stress protein n=1 Tax=Arthrobacter livingstonensis TaxID=670078 RepID=A0A2V5L6Q7_9MICC|nr:universal stress protein [Arthrobacter livingstonensis]PYI66908.1 universal stress protein [Arthrobacter livingstonensis]
MSVLVGYVLAPVGEAALAAGFAGAQLRGEELVVVNSVREGALVDKGTASPEDLARITSQARESGVRQTLLDSTYRDDLAGEVVDPAEQHDVSVIVLGLRQRSQVGKFIMGSHAQRILLQADRPVLAAGSR